MKIEEYYNLRIRRAIPGYLSDLGFKQHILNIHNKGEFPASNEFKFSFHPTQIAKDRSYTFYVDFLATDAPRVTKLLDFQLWSEMLYRVTKPYSENVRIELNNDNSLKDLLLSYKIIIKFDVDGWQLINSWRLR